MTREVGAARGDIILDNGWVIDRDFGHLTHGYVVTSHASQGVTVDKVFVAIGSQSLPAIGQRTAYVAITRGKEQAFIYTDDRKELLKAFGKPDEPISATELADPSAEKRTLKDRMKRMAFARGLGVFADRNGSAYRDIERDHAAQREADHAR